MTSNAHLSSLLLVIFSLLLLSFHLHVLEAQTLVAIAEGLSWTFYDSSRPKLQSIIRKQLKKVFKQDITLAAGLLRIHLHDCFVQGCDGSVLLDGSASEPSEKDAPPNLTLRAEAFELIDDLRELVQKKCGEIVSCADITALAVRDSTGGPDYDIPLERRDSLTLASRNETLANIPGPTSNTSVRLSSLALKNFDAMDVVVLSGAHAIGIGHCTSFTSRPYPSQELTMDKTLANNLRLTCPTSNTANTTVMDIRTPNTFDNKYYAGLMNRQGPFTSDQDLYTDTRTRDIVTSFAVNQTLFFEKFVSAMIKMGQLSVLTEEQGEIRTNCSATNSGGSVLESVMEEEKTAASSEF
ncbi:Peroxidase [Bertholletia excelsa]